ncbi:MAG: hypothetical protein JNK04_11175 [Myxococcales bacterium]|nr:hypothetical protein [Myxococcales bacterium]
MRRDGLLQDVHRIASRYHWAERDILALSWARRRRYLNLIDSESAASLLDELSQV